jgi:hypothetical protein
MWSGWRRPLSSFHWFNRALRSGRHGLAARLLAGRGELERLIAWYGR